MSQYKPSGEDAPPRRRAGGTTRLDHRNYGANLIIAAASNLAPPMAALVTAPFLARALGVSERGDLAAATAPMMLAATAATFGIPEALTYFTARRPHAARTMLHRALAVLLFASVLVALLSVGGAAWISGGKEDVRDLIIGLSLLIPPSICVGAFRGVAMGLHRWKLVACERLISAVLRIVLTFAFFFAGNLVLVTAAVAVATPSVVGILAYVPIVRIRRALPNGDVSKSGISEVPAASRGEMSRYGLRAWAGSISGVLLSRLDQAIMVPIAGSVQLGYYTVAISISDVTVLANNAMRDVTLSADAAERKDDRLFRTARVSLLVSLLAAGSVALTVWFWIDLVFGSEFHAAAYSVLILVASAAIATPGSVIGAALTARGMPGLRSISLFGAFVSDIAALIVLGPSLGAVGASLATAVGNQVAANMNIFFYKRKFTLTRRDLYRIRVDDVRSVAAGIRGIRRGLRRQFAR